MPIISATTVRATALGVCLVASSAPFAGCSDTSSNMSSLRDAEFNAMSDEDMIRQWALLSRKLEELKANPKALPDRIAMLENGRDDLASRLKDRDIDPDGIDIPKILEEIEDEQYSVP